MLKVLIQLLQDLIAMLKEKILMLKENLVMQKVTRPMLQERVVMQKEQGVAQFSPTVDGRYQRVSISEDTIEAVERALYGEDISQGALYFCARDKADTDKLQWFDRKLTKLFAYGNHEFFL